MFHHHPTQTFRRQLLRLQTLSKSRYVKLKYRQTLFYIATGIVNSATNSSINSITNTYFKPQEPSPRILVQATGTDHCDHQLFLSLFFFSLCPFSRQLSPQGKYNRMGGHILEGEGCWPICKLRLNMSNHL